MLGRLWKAVRVYAEIARQYRSASVTAEALVWHHGYMGLDAALKAVEGPASDDVKEVVRAELVARFAADRYMTFKHADMVGRALLLERWRRRRGSMIT